MSKAIRDFSTYFILVGMVTITAHLVYSLAFARVIEVADLHSFIADFPSQRQVRGVGRSDLDAARMAFIALTVFEVALIPILYRACRRVLITADAGHVPTAMGGWGGALSKSEERPPGSVFRWEVVVAIAFALVLGLLIERSGLLLAELLPADLRVVAVGIVRGSARALAAPFALVCMATASLDAKAGSGRVPKLL